MARHRFGLHLTDFAHPAWAGARLPTRLTEVSQALEDSEVFDTLWINDHLHHLGPEGPSAPRPEVMMLLAALASRTSKLRLGTLVAAATFRHAALLVKMVTTLDVLSGGRAILGIGAGHPRTEVEHQTYGIPFPPLGERMDRLEDALRLIRSMLSGVGPPNFPAPLGPIPVMVGGSGEQRLLRLVARYADLCNFSASAGDNLALIPHKLEMLRRHCKAVGRDPDEIGVTYKCVLPVALSEKGAADQAARQVAAVFDAGVDEVIVELPTAHDPDTIRNTGKALAMAMQTARVT